MTANTVVNRDLANVCRESLSPINAIQLLYMKKEPGSMSVLAIIPEKDFAIERMIYDRQLEIMAACPDFKFQLRVISLRGRKLSDVISPLPKGELLLERDAIAA